MKSEITETMESEYPILKINKTKNLVVLFLAPKKGIIVNSKDVDYKIGEFHEEWAEKEFFTEYYGTVKLSNK